MAEPPWPVVPGSHVDLGKLDPADTRPFADKEAAAERTAADLLRLRELQERLHVDGSRAVLLVLQGMDTSGKDGTVKHLSGGLSLLGSRLAAFSAPTPQELRHDFLWRIHRQAPPHGCIGVFNRSHYEDVLVARVHKLVPEAVWKARYAQINAFEELLASSGTALIKCYLHISKDEQKQRLEARLDEPDKRWKFDPGDLADRDRWHEYREAYEEALARCSSEHAPWYVVPADHKWYRNYAVTRLLVETLERLPLHTPQPEFDPHDMKRALR
ncbi:MAG TPA: PPK2 family polyphosphate kinase [Dehalococcoidia bacterium]|jgi:PPK2 family polyphosphate:nucleotide phosphotransferase